MIKAIRARDAGVLDAADSFATPHILLDAHVQGEFGGTGARVDMALARRFKVEHPNLIIWLAGGLTPANVADAVQVVQPRVVDVSSGVESAPGRKDAGKLRAFVLAANSD
jgi:phosphoribosylanthranilate isomerase